MDELKNLDRQLNDIWERVKTGSSPATRGEASFDVLSAERDMLQENLRQFKRHYTDERQRWETLLQERDRGAAALREERARLESELDRVRQSLRDLQTDITRQEEFAALEQEERESELKGQFLRHQSELKLYERQLKELESSHREETARTEKTLAHWREEERRWFDLMEKRDAELAALNIRLSESETLRQKNQAAHLDELAKRDAAAKEEGASLEQDKKRLQKSLENARAEIRNFQELLRKSEEEEVAHRQGRDSAEGELKDARDQAHRLQNELKTLREAWEGERAHWRELWDKERGQREARENALRDWENRLRQEREGWMAQMSSQQQAGARIIEQTGQTVLRLSEAVGKTVAPPPAALPEAVRGARAAPVQRIVLAGVGALALGMAAVYILFGGPAKFLCPVTQVSGLEVSGHRLWYGDWMNGQISEAAARQPGKISQYGVLSEQAHPVSVRWFQGRIWSLDTWGRVLREHTPAPPFAVQSVWPLMEQTPVDFAWDGQGVWVLDEAAQVLRRYPAGALGTPDRQTSLPVGWRLVSLGFSDGTFWGYDGASYRLRQFTLFPDIKVLGEYRLKAHERPESPLTAMSLTPEALWTLSEKNRTLYRWPRWALRFHR